MGNSQWESFPINELCIFAIDCVNKTAPIVDYETPYKMIRTTNVKDGFIDTESVRYVTEETFKKWTRRSKPQYGDVILTREAPVGSVGRFTTDDKNIFLGQRLFHYRPDPEKLDWNYLSYVLQSEALQGWLNGIAFGATVPHITVADAEIIKIPTPPIDIQKKIGKILSNYDDLIENNLKQIKLLEEKARLTYEEWFLRFRIDGQKLDIVKDTGLPFGWKRVDFNQYIDFLEGPGLRNWQYQDEGIPFLNIRILGDNDLSTKKIENYLDEKEVEKKYKHFLLHEYDHVISVSGTLGRVVTIRKNHLPMCLNTSIIRMRTKDKNIMSKWYIKATINHSSFKDLMLTYASGSAQLNFGPKHLNQMNILLPDQDTMNNFHNILEPIELNILNLLDQNNLLKESRDILLPRLMTGMIDVENMDIEV